MSVKVFTKPACVQCNATYRALDKKGIEYSKEDVTTNVETYEHLRDLGYMQMPVVEVRDGDGILLDSWSGFDPDKIKSLVA